MDDLFAFVRAALPWVLMGLALAIFFARRRNPPQRKGGDRGPEGMCIGMCLGSALGAAGVANLGISLSLGMLIGLVAGSCIAKKPDGR